MADNWFYEENHAYENGFESGDRGEYLYHALNEYYGHISEFKGKNVDILGYGAAEGAELDSVLSTANSVCIVDPTTKMRNYERKGKQICYYIPREDGSLEFADNSFDLITCFGVLMYVMNADIVLRELIRVLKPGGVLLICEPSTDMHVGDKRVKRWGMGKNTRGLPISFYNENLDKVEGAYTLIACLVLG